MRKRVGLFLSALVSFAVLLLVSITLCVAARPALAEQGLCSQPVTSGVTPTATDCLFILMVAVDTETCSPGCICAPKGTLPTTATDALVCLKYAVGQPVELVCPCSPPSTCPAGQHGRATSAGWPDCFGYCACF